MTLFHGVQEMLKHVGGRLGQNKSRVNWMYILLKNHWLNTLPIERLGMFQDFKKVFTLNA